MLSKIPPIINTFPFILEPQSLCNHFKNAEFHFLCVLATFYGRTIYSAESILKMSLALFNRRVNRLGGFKSADDNHAGIKTDSGPGGGSWPVWLGAPNRFRCTAVSPVTDAGELK